jgi:RNA polymerase sigma-70 factor (ECF subfamily)
MGQPAQDADQLLAAARAGSSEALGQVLETCRRYLLLVAERQLNPQLRGKGGASDLVQETFLEAQRDFAGFQGTSEAELLAWLSRILMNNVANFSRRYYGTNKRDVQREVVLGTGDSSGPGAPDPAAEMPSPSGLAMAQEQAEALQRALARLPDDYRRILELRFQEEKSFEEIGRLLDRSPDAARKLWSRAMQRLREEWEGSP